MTRRLVLMIAIVLGALMMFPEDAFARGGRGGGRGGGRSRGSVRGASRSRHRSRSKPRRSTQRERARRNSSRNRASNRGRADRSRGRGSAGGYHRRTNRGRVGQVSKGAPRGSVPVKAGNKTYRYHDGTFWAKRGNDYVSVRPPRGAAVNRLPHGHRHFRLRGNKYYYYNGCYYRWYGDRGRYVVEDAPADTIVYELPEDAVEVEIDGVTYYKYDDTLYKPVYVNGDLAYKVVVL